MRHIMESLTEEQLEAFKSLQDDKNIFVTGSGGTGKSFLIQTVYTELPRLKLRDIGLGIRISVTALTGCAAILLGCHAKTLHSWAGIGLGKGTVEDHVRSILKSPRLKKNWTCTDLLVIDEISMLTPELLEKLDDIGRIVRKNKHKPFGGIQLMLIGDFLQLPPITKGKDIQFAFESERWQAIVNESIELTQIQRQTDDEFRRILTEARQGALSPRSIDRLQERMYLDWRSNRIRPTLLFPRRAEVDMINESNLKALTGKRYKYTVKTVLGPEIPMFNMEDEYFKKYVDNYDKDASYLTELVLCEGVQVMLLANLDISNKLVNGSRGVVVGFTEGTEYPIVEFLSGIKMTIMPHNWELEDYPHVFRAQVPLRLAYAITTHKCQGSTLDCALIDIGSNIFEFGQAYVALSRVRSLDCLYIHAFDEDVFYAHPRVLAFYKKLRELPLVENPTDVSEDPSSTDLPWLLESAPDTWRTTLSKRKAVLGSLSSKLTDMKYLPKKENIWKALELTKPDEVRVVILGQDPYPTTGHAMGLAFSIEKDIRPLPGSLRNIFKELESDIGAIRTDGCLIDWAKQGVLLMNTVLTVEEGTPQSHSKWGWEEVTDELLESLKGCGIIFVLWGRSAQAKKKLLKDEIILEAAHPSPLSAHTGFYGSKPFSKINTMLEEKGLPAIRWA